MATRLRSEQLLRNGGAILVRKGIDFRTQRERNIRAQWVQNQSAMEDESEGNITAQRERDESGAQWVRNGCAKAQNQSAIQAKSEGNGSAMEEQRERNVGAS